LDGSQTATQGFQRLRRLDPALDPLVTRSFAPHEERMRALLSRRRGVPAVVAAAKERLTIPPQVYTETAIEQNRGLIHLVDRGLSEDIAATAVRP
jgi:hypothetical protein